MSAQKAILGVYRQQKTQPFAWGAADCLSWCADCALAITGTDPMKRLRKRYKTARGARKVMKTEGWADMAAVARSMFDEIPVAQARSGDWARILNPDGTDTLGVVVGHMIAARSETRGIGQVPLLTASRAFRVTAK